jgi:colanic acid/amylovoran biosynthesis glycosyltransferase
VNRAGPLDSGRRRPRVAFVLRDIFAPSVTFVIHQITGLIERGYEVEIYCDKLPHAEVPHGDITKYRLRERTHFWPKTALEGGAYALSRIPALTASGQLSPLIRALEFVPKAPGFALRSLGKAAALLSGSKHDAIICHFGNQALQVQALRDLGATDARLLAFFHGVDLSSWLRNKPCDVYKPLFDRADLLLPISERWKNKLVELGCNQNKIEVMHMGVRLERFTNHSRQNRDDKLHIFSAARLVPKKGIDVALRSLHALGAANRKLHYHIIGDGPERAALQHQARALQLSHCVSFHGWQTQEQLLKLHAGFDVCLVPSRTAPNGDEEGIPVVLMEALAASMPVISTRHSGIPELVRHGETGLLAEEGDAESLASCIHHALTHQSELSRLGVAGRALVAREFNAATLADDLARTLERVLATQPVQALARRAPLRPIFGDLAP